MDNGASYDGPTSEFVKSNVTLKWNDAIERSLSEEGNKVATNWKENKYDVDVKDKRRCPRNDCKKYVRLKQNEEEKELRTECDTKLSPSSVQIVLQGIIYE